MRGLSDQRRSGRGRVTDPHAPELAGHTGAMLTGGVAAVLLALTFFGLEPDRVDIDNLRILAGGLALGALLIWFIPWRRWSIRVPLVLLPLWLAVIIVGDRFTDLSLDPNAAALYTGVFFLMFGWVGVAQPRGTTLLVAPLATAALLIALTDNGDAIPWEVALVTIPGGVLLGETIAWAMTGMHVVRRLEKSRVDDLEALASSVAVLRHGRTTLEEAADLLGRLANDIFHGGSVTTVLRRRDGGLVPATLGASGDRPGRDTADLVTDAIANADVRLVVDGRGDDTVRLLVIPLVGATEIGGAVVVRQPYATSDSDPFTLHMARLFSTQAGSALEQIQVIESLSEDLRRDELTGLGNRRHALALLDSLMPGDAVVLVDLDQFKQVNDTDGHQAGDHLLRQLSEHLRSSVRDSDTVARLGGDEFVLVARSVEEDALHAASRLLERWRQREPRATFSAGVAVHDPDELPAITLEHADAALYQAKSAGRNQVRVYNPGLVGAR